MTDLADRTAPLPVTRSGPVVPSRLPARARRRKGWLNVLLAAVLAGLVAIGDAFIGRPKAATSTPRTTAVALGVVQSTVMNVLLGADDHDDDGAPTWRLLVIEDADELLRSDAKRETGQSLSRLLNLADGFIGRGLRTLVMITTNEALGRLHPAVVRPGRCLAEVEFPALARAEATALLSAGARPIVAAGEMTLAQVFERRGDVTRFSSQPEEGSTGQYL